MERMNGGDKGGMNDHGMVDGFEFSVARVIWFQYLALLLLLLLARDALVFRRGRCQDPGGREVM